MESVSINHLAVIAAALAGFGWASMAVGILSLFEMRGWKLMLINWGYVTVAFVVKGLILGLWR